MKDLKEERFGKLRVIQFAGRDKRGPLWECLCDCGNTKIVTARTLLSGCSNSCGCLAGKYAESLIGRRFGRLVVVEQLESIVTKSGKKALWLCKCDCGNTTAIRGCHLRKKNYTRSCGCLKGQRCPEDLSGEKFGRLTVVKLLGRPKNRKVNYWLCKCECGNEHIANPTSLKNGNTTSCGCWAAEIRTKHGMTGSKIYYVWAAMKQRCTNPNNKDYKSYGGRGITICKQWFDFKKFYEDMGEPSQEGYTLERIDNDKGYCPENCSWVSRKEQANNRKTNHQLELDGEVKTIKEWSEITGLDHRLIISRVQRGYTVKKALSMPPRPVPYRKDSLIVWQKMINRCTNMNDQDYPNYGGRGVKVAERWLNSFGKFCGDMGPRPKGASLNRIDNDKDYTPQNCRWADVKEQANNKRSNRYITYNNVTLTLQQWSRKTGLRREMIARRLNSGWSEEDALPPPPIHAKIYVNWHGKRMTLRELSDLTGVSPAKINGRIKSGWPLEAAVLGRKMLQKNSPLANST
ncbi:MAG: hypothetical protein ABFS18_11640 [Thermodesulfobacteriota bacterium]